MDNFDLKKYLVENKITKNSQLFEQDKDEVNKPIEPKSGGGAKELTTEEGSNIITPDMWSEEAKNDDTNLNFQKYSIAFSQNVVIKQILNDGEIFTTIPENDVNGEMVLWYSDELDPTKAYIKGSEQDPNLFEQD